MDNTFSRWELIDGKAKFEGRLRAFNKDNDFTFLDSDDAGKKFGSAQSDVFLHKSHMPKELVDLPDGVLLEFDVVMYKHRPQARNLALKKD